MKRLVFVLVLLVSCSSNHGGASTRSPTPQTYDLTVIVDVYDGYYSAAFPPKPKEACRNEPISSATQLSVADENGSLVGIGNFEDRGELTDKLQNEVVCAFSTIVEHLPKANFYVVTIDGFDHELRYSFDEMESNSWTVTVKTTT